MIYREVRAKNFRAMSKKLFFCKKYEDSVGTNVFWVDNGGLQACCVRDNV